MGTTPGQAAAREGSAGGGRRGAVVADRVEALLVPLVVVVGGVGVAVGAPARVLDRAGAVDPTLAVLVFTAGLTIDAAGLGDARWHWARFVTVLAASSVALPALAWALAQLVPGPARDGILAVGVAPSEVASLGLAAMAGGEVAVSAALLIASSVVTVVASGPILTLESGAAGVHAGGLLTTLALVVGLPLAAGAAARRLLDGRPGLLDAGRLLGIAVLLGLLWEVAGEVQLRVAYLAVTAALAGFLAGAGLLGWLLARGLPAPTRPAVLLPVSMRDFAVAAGIAASAFGPRAVGPLGVYGLLVLLAGAVVARLTPCPNHPTTAPAGT
ncbi:MAG TPA: bile acid:sodium symporter [Acidimicrobiales bacterium]|nr:bile acid:sodium symporter [Acidimicrobiales bacterium]